MVGGDESQVSLRLADGKVAPVPLVSLITADQAYVKVPPGGTIPARNDGPGESRAWPDEDEGRPIGGRGFHYQSVSFEYRSADRPAARIKEVARTFQATKRLVAEIPWGVENPVPVMKVSLAWK
ncbi:MAG: hypothetical protein ABI162_18140 [Luteolibacter sp.]